jgi:hypothetical protein
MEDGSPESPELKNNQRKSTRGKHGGRRSGAGRKKGVPNKLTADVKAGVVSNSRPPNGFCSVATQRPSAGSSVDYSLARLLRWPSCWRSLSSAGVKVRGCTLIVTLLSLPLKRNGTL